MPLEEEALSQMLQLSQPVHGRPYVLQMRQGLLRSQDL